MFLCHSQPPSFPFLSPFLLSLFHSILANTASRRSKSSRNTRHPSRERSSSHEAAAACILARAVLLEPDSTAICSPRQLICVLLLISFVCRCLLVGLITCTYEYGYLALFYFILFIFFNPFPIAFRLDGHRTGLCTGGQAGTKGHHHTYNTFLFFYSTPLVCSSASSFCALRLLPPIDIIISFFLFFIIVLFFSPDLITYIHTYLLTYCHHCTEYSYTLRSRARCQVHCTIIYYLSISFIY